MNICICSLRLSNYRDRIVINVTLFETFNYIKDIESNRGELQAKHNNN